jgi:predicted esterase
MCIIRTVLALLLAALALQAQILQTSDQIYRRLTQFQTVDVLSMSVRMLRDNTNAGAGVKAEAEKLSGEATKHLRAGDTGDARRKLLHCIAVLRGLPWNELEQYIGSLTLRTDTTIADSSAPFTAQLTQSYRQRFTASDTLQLHIWLSGAATASPGGNPATAAKVVQDIGVYPLYSRDLIDQPFRFDAALNSLPDGSYQLMGEVLEGKASIGTIGWIPVTLVRGLQSRQAVIEQRLASILGHESAKATIRYPFDLARTINLVQRDPVSFDFPQGILNSEKLLQALQSGTDPLWRARGDHKRHYWFAEAREIMPYRVYVPESWNGRSKLPLMMMLHGGGGDEDSSMDQNDGQLPKLAEQHGYIVVSPLGYRPLGAYGNPMMLPAVFGNPTREGRAVGDERRKRMLELSEKDVMNVLELVADEYGINRSRIYLAGHSMGSGGTWHIGAKYAETWAALAPLSGPFVYEDYPFERIKKMPIFYTEGTGATPSLEGSRVLARYLKEKGFNAIYMEVDGTHGSMVEMVMPKVFEFFDQLLHRQ